MLQSSASQRRLPWVELFHDDLQALWANNSAKLAALPDPKVDTAPWVAFMTDFPYEWKQLVK
eukprot:299559-Karenia_brevis.AAC.1